MTTNALPRAAAGLALCAVLAFGPSRALSAEEAALPAPEGGGEGAAVTLVHRLDKESELPAMKLSLGLVNFVGETEEWEEGVDKYAFLPLNHDAVLEVYDLHYDGKELTQAEAPSLIHEMTAGEAYVLRVPYFGGVPTRGVCVTSRGKRSCWNPGGDEMNEGFLNWSKTKGLR